MFNLFFGVINNTWCTLGQHRHFWTLAKGHIIQMSVLISMYWCGWLWCAGLPVCSTGLSYVRKVAGVAVQSSEY